MTESEMRAEIDRLQIELDRLGVATHKNGDGAELSLYGRVLALMDQPDPRIAEMRTRAAVVAQPDGSRQAAIAIDGVMIHCFQKKTAGDVTIYWSGLSGVGAYAEYTRSFAYALLAIAEIADEWEGEGKEK